MNNVSLPLVSVVVPAYNAEAFLEETLKALLAEPYPALEILVVNDGSTDGTADVIRRFVAVDGRVRLLEQPNGGVCRARNFGISEAHGRYILPVDADDLLLSGFIEWGVTELEQDPELKVAVPKAEFFGAKTGPWHLPPFSLHLLARKNMIPATALFRRADWERVGGYNEQMQAREDWEFWIHVLKDGGHVLTSPELGLRYRIHAASKRTADRTLKHQVVDALNERHPEFFQRMLGGPLHYSRSWSRLFNGLKRLCYCRHLTVASGYEGASDFFRALPAIFQTKRGEILYKRRNEIRSLSYAGGNYVVKSFHLPNLVNRLVYGFLRPSKARRSYEYSLLLQRHGIGTPTPVAYYSERFLGILFGRSYYVSLLSTLPYTYVDILSGIFSPADEERYLRAIAKTAARLHEAGMVHMDFSRGNILFGDGSDGVALVELIDLNRIRFHQVSQEEGCRNFAERLPATPEQRRTMATAYAEARGFDAETCLRLMIQYNRETE